MKKEKSIKIGLDFDSTYTADPLLWDLFIKKAISSGHEVKFVTIRYADPVDNNDILDAASKNKIEIIFSGMRQKANICEQIGWMPDIWIDDAPETIPLRETLEAMAEGCKKAGE